MEDVRKAKRSVRMLVWFIAAAILPFVIAQAFAFGSFIFEEALQAQAFAVRAALLSEDQAFAVDATLRFEKIMIAAQDYQSYCGRMAFWTHEAYETYFWSVAPAQLAGMYLDGKRLGLWGEAKTRWQKAGDGEEAVTIDTWRNMPIETLRRYGFKPEIDGHPVEPREKKRKEINRGNRLGS